MASPLGSRELDLDVVRGVAILLAIGWHLVGRPTGNPISDVLLAPARTFGWAGVDLFFVLSGFLVGRLIFREHAATGNFDARRFLVRRAFKLWPLYYLFLLYLIVTHLADDPWRYLPNLLHVQNYLQAAPPHLWSLAVEEHFYLAVALLLPITFRRGMTPRTLLISIGLLMAATLLARMVARGEGLDPRLIQQLSHFRVDALLAGIALAVISVYYPLVFDRMVRWKSLWLGLTLGAVTWLSTVPKHTNEGATVGYTVAYVGAAAFMLLLYRARWVVTFRAVLRPIGLLGVYSYAIYLTHVSAAGYINRFFETFLPFVNESPLRLVSLYAGVVLVAIVATRVVEWPALKVRDRVAPRRTNPAASTMVAPAGGSAPREGAVAPAVTPL